ncbi:putative FAD dependent oxidoreductase [Truncatella angustata]|uniref:FAD dependent oxidoreductase n=1 Tax=Truncatella angustata TaxID=152316 RepID=A0A9P9A2D2_9PEZI|nr:putative FAD dependent oxidoreductase [Truncatella angustata]KAH6659013.1 putative FAD dependent oxidoreductase [Truncatella angustata]KAH8200700.1 hypothetical protein TruAng_005164 [Truncatella angustata]
MAREKVAVVGAGIFGLTIALLLSEAGCDVEVIARNLPGDESTEWASPWAGALLAPHPDSGLNDLQVESLRFYQNLLEKEPSCGVKKIHITEYYDDRPNDSRIWYSNVVSNFCRLASSRLPAPATLGFEYEGLAVNPNDFMPWIVKQLQTMKVKLTQNTIASMEELRQITDATILVNAAGLGAGTLASDEAVHAVRGQTMFVPCDFNRAVLLQGSQYTYVIPRQSSGGVILGGVSQPGDTRTEPDQSIRPDIMHRVNQMTGGEFLWVNLEKDVAKDIVGFRPSRKGGVKVQRDGDIVHAYGGGSLGWLYAFGVAKQVRKLVLDGNEHRAKL